MPPREGCRDMIGGTMTAAIPHVVRLSAELANPEEYLPPAEKIIAGEPRQRIWSRYTDPSGQFTTGIWEGEPGTWRIRYTEEEYCRILEGRSVLTANDGKALQVGPGDEFVIPRGFEGTWQVVERTRKVYVIYEAQQ